MAQNEEILQEQEHCEEPVQEVREPEQEAAEETAEVKEENPCAELESSWHRQKTRCCARRRNMTTSANAAKRSVTRRSATAFPLQWKNCLA